MRLDHPRFRINTKSNGLPWWLRHKVFAYIAGDLGLIPGSGRSPEEENGNPLQYSCLENPMDRGAWWATVHRVTKSRTWLSDFNSLHFTKSNDWYRVGKALGWWRQRLRHHTLRRLQGNIFSCLFEFWLAQVLVFWCLCWHLYFGLLTSITGKEYISAAWSHQISGNLLR